jgi:hypothetical protein
MELNKLKDKIEKSIIAVATANQKNKPHNIVISLDENKEHLAKGAIVINVKEIKELG